MTTDAAPCHFQGCYTPATLFSYLSSSPVLFCPSHVPIPHTRAFPIAHIAFFTSSDDTDLYLTRKEEAEIAVRYLDSVLSAAVNESSQAIAALERQRAASIAALNESYDSEVRRTSQHFHQITVSISDHRGVFESYLRSQSTLLTDLEKKMTVEGLVIPRMLRSHVCSLEVPIRELIARSCTRGELPCNKHLAFFVSPIGREMAAKQLIRKAGDLKESTDLVDMQRAIDNVSEAIQISNQDEVATALLSQLRNRYDDMLGIRLKEANKRLNDDCGSISALISQFRDQISAEELSECALALVADSILYQSQSRETADFMRNLLDSYVQTHECCDYSKVREWYRTALAIRTDRYPEEMAEIAQFHYSISSLLHKEKQWKEAESTLFQALHTFESIDPSSLSTAEAYSLFGRIYTGQLRHEEASSALTAARRVLRRYHSGSIERARTYLYSGELFRRMKDRDTARKYLAKAVAAFESSGNQCSEAAQAQLQLGTIYRETREMSLSNECFRAAIQIYSKTEPDSLHLGDAYMELGLSLCLTSIGVELFPTNSPEEQFWLACNFEFMTYDRAEAEECLNWAACLLQRDGYSALRGKELIGIYKKLADIHIQKHDFGSAEHFLKLIIDSDPDVSTTLAMVYVAVGEYQLAEGLLSARINSNACSQAMSAVIDNDLAVICLYLGKYTEAEERFLRALESFQDEFDRRYVSLNLVLLYRELERHDDTEKVLQRLYAETGDIANFADSLGKSAMASSDLLQENLCKIFNIQDRVNVIISYTTWLESQGRFDEALCLLATIGDGLQTKIHLGADKPEPVFALRIVMDVLSTFKYLIFDLGVLLIQTSDFHTARLCFITFANVYFDMIPIDSDLACCYLNLAIANTRLGRTYSAIGCAQQAASLFAEISPDSPYINLANMWESAARGETNDEDKLVCVPSFAMNEPIFSKETRIVYQRMKQKTKTIPMCELFTEV